MNEIRSAEEREVVRYWLETFHIEGTDEYHAWSKRELIEELQSRQGGPTSIFDNHSIDWKVVELSEAEFRDLKIVKGPPNSDWRLILPNDDSNSPDLEAVASRIDSASSIAEFDSRIQGKVKQVKGILEAIRDGADLGKFIVLKEQNWENPWIVDGNHRAVAACIHLLNGGDPGVQRAYYGQENPSIFS